MRPTLLAFCAFLMPILLFSQSSEKIKWGKIPSEDLAMRVYDQDSSATALILNDKTESRVVFYPNKALYILDRHIRIKILSEEGFDQGDVSIETYTKDKTEKLRNVKAQVILPDGTKHKLDDENIFKSKSKYFSETNMNFPHLVVGCVLEYSYTIESQDFFSLRPWNFQRDIPVRDASLDILMPNFLEYVTLVNGNEYVKKEGSITYVNHVPAMKEEPFIATMDDYLGSIRFQLKSIDKESQFSTWKSTSKKLNEHEFFGKQISLNRIKSLEIDSRPIIDRASEIGKEELLVKLGNIVLDNFEWNGDYGFLTNKDIDECLVEKVGNSAVLNLAFLSLLEKTEYDAYPLLVSTRDHGRLLPHYPFVLQFNHVMVLVENGDNNFIVDLSSKAKPVLLPRANSLNGAGLIIYSEDAEIFDLPIYKSTEVFSAKVELTDENKLQGSITCSYKNHIGIDERQKYIDEEADKIWTERLSRNEAEATVTFPDVVAQGEINEKFSETLEVDISGKVELIDDLLLLNANIYFPFTENPFKSEERNYPIDVNYPMRFVNQTSIKIPEGYEIESIPDPILAEIPSGLLKFKNSTSQNGANISIVRELKFESSLYSSSEYEMIRAIFELIFEKIEEPIVLKKI